MSSEPPHPLRFFLDANVPISAAWKANAEVALIWRLQNVQLLTSILVMAEVQRNLPHFHQIERLRIMLTAVEILPVIEWSAHAESIPELLQLPQKDRHVLASACHHRADYLITGDKKRFSQWFGQTIQGVRIEPPTHLLDTFQLRHP